MGDINPELLAQAQAGLDAELSTGPSTIDPNIMAQAQAGLDAQLQADQASSDAEVLKNREADSLPFVPQVVSRTLDSVNTGIAKAVFETKDFFVGEPDQANKSDTRKEVEAVDRALRRESAGFGVVSSISQFAVGIVGAGKFIKAGQLAGKGVKLAVEVAKGAVAGAVVIDPQEERLSNLIQQYPALRNPVTEFLATSPDDSAAFGRFKNALEGILVDLTVVGTLAASVKVVKALRSGDHEAAIKAAGEVGDATTAQANVARERLDTPAGGQTAPVKVIPKVTEVDLDTILKNGSDDREALLRHGSREDALDAGYVFKGSDKIPMQKIGGSDEVKVLMANTAKVLEKRMDAAKGGAVLTDPKVTRLAKHITDIFGEDPDVVMGAIAKAAKEGNSMVANMEAGLTLSTKLFDDAYNVSYKIENGLLDEWGGDIAKAHAELVDRISAASEMFANSRAIVATMGRGLRRMRSDFAIRPEDLDRLKTMDPEKLQKAMSQTKGDPRKIKNVMNPGWVKRLDDELSFLLANNLLWNYPTHIVNMVGNTYQLAARPAEKYLGSIVVRGDSGRTIRREALQEFGFIRASLGDSWSMAIESFKKGDSIIDPHSAEAFQTGRSLAGTRGIDWKPINSVSDMTENLWKAQNIRTVLGAPTRALGAADEFFKNMRYRAFLQAKASTEAMESGLQGSDITDFIQKRLNESFDDTGKALDPRALLEAQTATFTQDLLPGTVGKGVQNLRSNVKFTSLVLPFIKTPVNVIRAGHRMTPGLNLLQREFRMQLSGKAGVEAQAQAMGQFILGSTFMGMSAMLANDGLMTGGGPADFQLKKELMATGWKPYSFVKTAPDGSKTYFPMGRFDPAGLPFSIAADLMDMMVINPKAHETSGWDEAITASIVAIAKNFGEKTFLLNVNQLMRALTEPDTNFGKFMGNLGGNLIPGSSALKAYVNADPNLRDARGVVDNLMKNLPGFSANIPPQRDAFGDPIIRRIGLTSSSKPDVVQEEHNRLITTTGSGLGKMAPTRNGVDLRDLELEDGRTAYDRLQENVGTVKLGGKTLKQNLERLINKSSYQRLVDDPSNIKGTKMFEFSRVVSKYRQAAYRRLLKDSKMLQQSMQSRITEVRSLFRAKNTNDDSARELLDALGLTQ